MILAECSPLRSSSDVSGESPRSDRNSSSLSKPRLLRVFELELGGPVDALGDSGEPPPSGGTPELPESSSPSELDRFSPSCCCEPCLLDASRKAFRRSSSSLSSVIQLELAGVCSTLGMPNIDCKTEPICS